MMTGSLLEEARSEFYRLAEYLQHELKRLHDEGVLTRADWLRLIEDSRLSGQAVLGAIDRADYPPQMREELVKNLITQYEASIEKILEEARRRRYSIERIEGRLRKAEEQVATNWSNAVRAQMVTKSQHDRVMKTLRSKHKEVTSGLKSIPGRHPRRMELIESWLTEYEADMNKLSRIPLPRLSYAASRPVSYGNKARVASSGGQTKPEEEKKLRRGVIRRLLSILRGRR